MTVPYSTGIMLDLVGQIAAVAADIQATRVGRGLKQLVCPAGFPTFPILVGEEQVAREQSPPRIVFVPQGITTEPALIVGRQPMAGQVGQQVPRPFFAAGSTSTLSSGATRTSLARTRSTTSTRPRSYTASYVGLYSASAAASPTFASGRLDGSERPTTSGTDGSSSSLSRSPRTSLMSRCSFSRSRQRSPRWPEATSRSRSPRKSTGPMAQARRSEPSTYRSEAV